MAPQLTTDQRNFLLFEYIKLKGRKSFLPDLIRRFQEKFNTERAPSLSTITRILDKQLSTGTINNLNSKTSPGTLLFIT